jgi:oxygen-independent coproporphyrinogen III oxidase
VIEAVNWARQAGFDNLNLDLIFGLPEQTLERWQGTVRFVIGLKPEHLSLYALTVEHGTPFGRWARHGMLPMPDPDQAADMYEWAAETLEAAGFEQYEISNWAKPGRQCRHNLQYWRGKPYLGFGAGAHGFADGMRISNVLRIKTFIERIKDNSQISRITFPVSPGTVNQTRISRHVEMQEMMMTGLRLTQEGVSAQDFEDRFDVNMKAVFEKEIDELVRLDLLEWANQSLHLTKRGRLLGNQAFMRFVD